MICWRTNSVISMCWQVKEWAVPGVKLYNAYGVTEATVYQFTNRVTIPSLPAACVDGAGGDEGTPQGEVGTADVPGAMHTPKERDRSEHERKGDSNSLMNVRKVLGVPLKSVQYQVRAVNPGKGAGSAAAATAVEEVGIELNRPGQVGELVLFGEQLTSTWPPPPPPPPPPPLLPPVPPTARLAWRWWNAAADANLAEGLWGDTKVTTLIGGPFDAATVTARLAAECQRAREEGVQYWPVFLRDASAEGGLGEHVGVAGLRRYYGDAPSCSGLGVVMEIGFHLKPAHWCKGLATEAAAAVLVCAFEKYKADAVFAGHNPKNEGSRRTLLKLGFGYTHAEFYKPTGLMHPSYILKARPSYDRACALSTAPGSLPAQSSKAPERALAMRAKEEPALPLGKAAIAEEGEDAITEVLNQPAFGQSPPPSKATVLQLNALPQCQVEHGNTIITRRRCHRTGDLVMLCEDGTLSLQGRVDNQVKLNGQRLALEEVEAAVCASAPTIVATCVCRIATHSDVSAVRMHNRHGGGSARLKVAIQLQAGAAGAVRTNRVRGGTDRGNDAQTDANIDAIMVAIVAAVESVLPRAFVPLWWSITDAWPLSSSGKIDRPAIFAAIENNPSHPRAWDWKYGSSNNNASRMQSMSPPECGARGTGGTGDSVLVLTSMECTVAAVWADVLQIDLATINPGHTLVDLGGDSLSTLRVVRQLHAALGVTLDLRSKEGRVGELAGALAPSVMLQTPRLDEYAALLERTFGPRNAGCNGSGAGAVAERGAGEEKQGGGEQPQPQPQPLCQRRADGSNEDIHDADDADDAEERIAEDSNLESPPPLAIRLVAQARLNAALCVASKGGLYEAAGVLLRSGADSCGGIPFRDHGYSPLHAACANGHLKVARLLLASGARVNGTTAARVTAAHAATGAGHLEVLVALLEVGCSVKIRDSNKQGLLHHAARHGRVNICRHLLAPPHCLDPDASDKWHRSPLQWAVVNGHAAAVRALLAGGANPNFGVRASVHKRTTTLLQEPILHIAARNAVVRHGGGSGGVGADHLGIVRVLIESGAAQDAQDENGATAFDAASAFVASNGSDGGEGVERDSDGGNVATRLAELGLLLSAC